VKRYKVVFSDRATDQLEALYDHIAHAASPTVAERYTKAVVACCEGLKLFPHRCAPRDDIRPGLRLTHHKGRTVIAFAVDDGTMTVGVLGIYYGGQDYESDLALDSKE
jgi:plasmid stabilization system protein ParE